MTASANAIRVALAVAALILESRHAVAQAQTGEPLVGTYVAAGLGGTRFRGECCERRAGELATATTVVLEGGLTLKRRADVGAKVIWTTATDEGESLNTLAIVASAAYRFWPRRGFYVSGGAGMGVVTDIFELLDESTLSDRAKGLAVDIAAGWEWPLWKRMRIQAFGSQHVVSLGDLPTPVGVSLDNLIINYWSIGARLVFRP